MIKTPLSTVIGGAFWTPGATVINGKEIFSVFVKSLFANGEQGFFYDPNDLNTMFQDAAGTVPVTAVGQPVGLVLDKSGRNNHAFQTVSASRPILQRNATTGAYYLALDGADDFLQTNSIDFSATDKVSVFVGVRKLSDALASVVFETGTDTASINGTFGLYAPRFNGQDRITFASRGTATVLSNIAAVPSPIYSVVTAKAQISTDLNRIYFNSNQKSNSSSTDQGTGNYGNYPLYIGRREGSSLPFSGHLYSLIGIGKLTSDDETLVIEKELAKRVGVALNV